MASEACILEIAATEAKAEMMATEAKAEMMAIEAEAETIHIEVCMGLPRASTQRKAGGGVHLQDHDHQECMGNGAVSLAIMGACQRCRARCKCRQGCSRVQTIGKCKEACRDCLHKCGLTN